MRILEKKNAVIVFLICSAVGILSGTLYYNQKPAGDSTYYFNSANLLKKNLLALLTTSKIGVGESLNAIFQGVAMMLPGNDFVNVYTLQIVVYAFTGLIIYLLAEIMLGKMSAWLTLAFYLVNHAHWAHIYNFKPGVWVNLFLIGTIYFSCKALNEKNSSRNYFYIACFAALLLLTDMRYLPHIAFVYVILLVAIKPIARGKRKLLISGVTIAAIISPWIIRQSIVFNKFIFISDIHTVTIAKLLNAHRYQALRRNSAALAKLTDNEFNSQFWQLLAEYRYTPGELIYAREAAKIDVMNSKGIEVEKKYRHLIEGRIFSKNEIDAIISKEERKPWYRKRIEAGLYLWAPFNCRYFYAPLSTFKTFIPPASKMSNLNRMLTLGILLPFLLIGILHWVITRNLFGILLLGIFVIHTVVHAFTYVQWRYLLPILPLVTLAAIHGMIVTSKLVFKRKHKES